MPLPCKDMLLCMGITLGYLNIIPGLVNAKRKMQKYVSQNVVNAEQLSHLISIYIL